MVDPYRPTILPLSGSGKNVYSCLIFPQDRKLNFEKNRGSQSFYEPLYFSDMYFKSMSVFLKFFWFLSR